VNYQWHTTTPEFLAAADELVAAAAAAPVAVLCAEGVWWRCHRSMIADFLVATGHDAVHLQPARVAHSEVIGDRLQRYDPEVLDVWRRHAAARGRGPAAPPVPPPTHQGGHDG
jgi:hypothetical protein